MQTTVSASEVAQTRVCHVPHRSLPEMPSALAAALPCVAPQSTRLLLVQLGHAQSHARLGRGRRTRQPEE
eukprot:6456066-Amphidinium_carterae.1